MIEAWPAHAAAWRVGGKLIIGLVVAQDDTTAQALINAVAAGAPGPATPAPV
jgi:hypothetical protein